MSSPEQSAKPAGVENPSVPAVGTVPENRYELLQLVGHGGMGAVYRVQDRTEDRTLALKLLTVEEATGVRRFQREYRFAVGTALTGGPPHRSQRALLTHWAPTSGHDAQSLFGVRVQNTNRWKPAVGQTVHALPGHPVSLAPLP